VKQVLKEWIVDKETGELVLLGINELEAQRDALNRQHLREAVKGGFFQAFKDAWKVLTFWRK
jgi:hypothetical protein